MHTTTPTGCRGGGVAVISTEKARFRWASAAVAAIVGISVMGAAAATSAATGSTKELTVDLAAETGPAIQPAQGLLYGITADATQPAEEYLKPLNLNSFRGGGWFAGGWRGDGYTLGPKTQSEIDSIIAQATRLKAASSAPDDFHYEVILSDLWGSTGGAPANSLWPCNGGDCSNWVQFITQTVGQLEASGITFSYDIWNEPDLAIFWAPGVNTAQYNQMWDVGYATLRAVAPGKQIVGPSFAYTPERRPAQWTTWFAHVRAADTVPDWISNHNEGEGGVPAGIDDPVTVAQSIRDGMTAAGIEQRPLSSNEYQGAGKQTADTTAWYVNRLAQSTYTTAMRGNWNCCMTPNLTGLLSKVQTGWAPNGNWWALKTGADMTGTLVQTSQQVDRMSISAAKDESKQQAVALLGDIVGFTGSANVKFTGLDSAPYLVQNGKVHATVYAITEGVLYAPKIQFSGDLPVAADGSITVPTNFVGAHDAASIYLSPTETQTLTIDAPAALASGQAYDVPVTILNSSATTASNVSTSLGVTASDPAQTAGITITCSDGGETCPTVDQLAPGESTTATFHVALSPSTPALALRLVGTGTLEVNGATRTISNSVDLIGTCVVGMNCEVEDGTLVGGACYATNHTGFTGTGFVACFDTTASGRGVSQKFSVASAGTYTLDLRYAAGHDGPAADVNRTATVTVNGVSQQISMPPTTNWNTWGVATTTVELAAGTNTVSIVKETGDNGWFNLDHLVLQPPAQAGPKVEITSASRCVAGKVVLVITAHNQDQGSATVTTETPYGTASFGSIVAGSTASKALTTRKASIPAGAVTTTATAMGTSMIETPVAAAICN